MKFFALVYSTATLCLLLVSAWTTPWPLNLAPLAMSALFATVIACLLRPRTWLKPLVVLVCALALYAFARMHHDFHWLGLLVSGWFLLGPVSILSAVFTPKPAPAESATPARDREFIVGLCVVGSVFVLGMGVGVYGMRPFLGHTTQRPAPLPQMDWKRSEVAGLSVELPSPLRPGSASHWTYPYFETRRLESYEANAGDIEIGVSVLEVRDRDANIDNAASGSLDFMMGRLGRFSTSKEVKSIIRDGCSGRDVTLTSPTYGNPMLMRYQLLVRDESVWTVVVSGHSAHTKAVADRILASIRVLPQP